MDKKWETLASDDKQEAMFQRWLSPEGIEFASTETEKAYKERVTRIKDAIQLKKAPDRVPVIPTTGFFPCFYSGFTPQDMMYDYDKLYTAFKKYVLDFEPDAHLGLFHAGPGKVFDILDYKMSVWPGHGAHPEHSYQHIEGEYVMADEYDSLIQDPSNFFRSVYLPRVFGALKPFKKLPPLTGILMLPFTGPNLLPYGFPDVQDAYKALLEAGSEALKWGEYVGKFDKEMTELGFPDMFGGFSAAPFDVIGDTLRGTKEIMLDMYRRPEKLIEALEAVTPIMINMGLSYTEASGNPIVFIPLHKGADGFLSDEQFKKFYWPTFRKVLMGLINEGRVPLSFAEGGYNSRLEIISDLPKGKVIWLFDQTDMARAKETVGRTTCITGNMPIVLLMVGTPKDVRDYTKKTIGAAGKGGGYMMFAGAVIDDAKPENIKAMIDSTKEYGIYK